MKILKLLVLMVMLSASPQSCSYISKKWDERPSWMGNKEESAGKEVRPVSDEPEAIEESE